MHTLSIPTRVGDRRTVTGPAPRRGDDIRELRARMAAGLVDMAEVRS